MCSTFKYRPFCVAPLYTPLYYVLSLLVVCSVIPSLPTGVVLCRIPAYLFPALGSFVIDIIYYWR